jgi:putative two-component system response regulator
MTAESALEIGVYDYIIKPFNRNGVLISVANVLRRRQLEIDNRAYRESLQKMVLERTAALQDSMEKLGKALEGSILTIASIVETRDPYTAGHQQRVADLACAIAKEMGLPDDQIYGIRMGGVIHDLGKISIPAEILSKPGRITEIEFDLIKTHPRAGYDILKTNEFPWPIAQMVLQHHERMNGSGYPAGLSGEGILLESRILGVADVVEAMASHRPYRPALGTDKALKEISSNKGSLYDSEVVEACLKLFKEKKFAFD